MAKKAKFKDSVILSAVTYCTLALLQVTFTNINNSHTFIKLLVTRCLLLQGREAFDQLSFNLTITCLLQNTKVQYQNHKPTSILCDEPIQSSQ